MTAKVISFNEARGDYELESKGWIENPELFARKDTLTYHNVLNKNGYPVFKAKTGEECVAWIKKQRNPHAYTYHAYVMTDERRTEQRDAFRYQRGAMPHQRHDIHVRGRELERTIDSGKTTGAFWDKHESPQEAKEALLSDAFDVLSANS